MPRLTRDVTCRWQAVEEKDEEEEEEEEEEEKKRSRRRENGGTREWRRKINRDEKN